MTREEAIEVLSSYDVNGVWADVDGKPYNAEEQAEAFDMAIEALKQVTGKLNNPEDSLLTADPEACKEQKSKLDLISRAEAIESIEIVDWYHQNSNKDMVSGANDDEHQAWYKADDVYKALEAVPSAGRPRGGWIEKDEYGDLFVCSECGSANVYKDNFCPDCGADMRGDMK